MRKILRSVFLIACLAGGTVSPASAGSLLRTGHGTVSTGRTIFGAPTILGVATLDVNRTTGAAVLTCGVVDPFVAGSPNNTSVTHMTCTASSNRGHFMTIQAHSNFSQPATVNPTAELWTGMDDSFAATVCIEGHTYAGALFDYEDYPSRCAPVEFVFDAGASADNTYYCRNEANNEQSVGVEHSGQEVAFLGTDYDFGSGVGSGVLVCAAVASSVTGPALGTNAGIGGITSANPHVVKDCSPDNPYGGGTGSCVVVP